MKNFLNKYKKSKKTDLIKNFDIWDILLFLCAIFISFTPDYWFTAVIFLVIVGFRYYVKERNRKKLSLQMDVIDDEKEETEKKSIL